MAPMFNPKAPELFQAQTHLYNHIFSYIHSMSLKCAVQLNIPDIVHKHGKPITLPELATSLKICPTKYTSLYRLMRILVQSGFFATTKIVNDQEDGELGYILTPPSRLLVKENHNCLSPFVMSMLNPDFMFPSHQLADWFRVNEHSPFEKAHGMTFWDYNVQNPECHNLFNEAMACDSQMMNLVIGDNKSVFEGISSIVDVGGGTGSLARVISEAFPEMKCVVLDLPCVVANLKGTKNLEFLGGDMFQCIPSADAVILKLIMHGWGDEECVKILKKCKESISGKSEGGKVIIIDVVINEKNEEHELTETKLLLDMLMMVVASGKERSKTDWERLFHEAGFSRYKFTPMLGLRTLIEVYP